MKLSEYKEYIINKFGEKLWGNYESSYAYSIYLSNEEEQKKELQKDGTLIRFINNPSEEVQLESIKKGPWNVMFIKNPTDKVIAEVLKSSIHIRTLIKDILRHIEDDLKEEK